MSNEIALAYGITIVPLAAVPALIAKALHPPVWCTQAIGRIGKYRNDNEERQDGQSYVVPLNEEEQALLDRAWIGLPSPIGATSWWPYQDAFDALERKPEWRPAPVWCNPQAEAAEKREAMRIEAEKALDRDIEQRTLTVDVSNGERVVPVGELERYVAQKSITMRFSVTGDHVPTAMERAAQLIGWFDSTMNAATWFRRADIKFDEAAMLLCRINPLKRDRKRNPSAGSPAGGKP